MNKNNFRGELTDTSAKKEALAVTTYDFLRVFACGVDCSMYMFPLKQPRIKQWL